MANALLMRMLADAWQVCFFEPQGHAAKFIDAVGRGGKRYVLTMNESLNILDIAVGRDEQGRRRHRGANAVRAQSAQRALGNKLAAR